MAKTAASKSTGCGKGCGCLVVAVLIAVVIGSQKPRNRPPQPASQEAAPSSSSATRPATPAVIPGLAAVDVHGNLTNKGFKLTKLFGREQSEWICVEETAAHSMTAQALGPSPTEITAVKATYLNFSNEDTDQKGGDFLAYVATIPFEGSQPERAKAWVKENISKGGMTSFGDVTFELIANPNAPRTRMLVIQPTAATR